MERFWTSERLSNLEIQGEYEKSNEARELKVSYPR